MVRAGLFTRHSSPNGQHDYSFSHALIRDTAYASLTRKPQLQLHRRVASALVELGGASEPALLAYHYTKAGQLPSAIEWWTAAGRANFAAAHYDESIASFQRGLTLVKDLADADAWRVGIRLAARHRPDPRHPVRLPVGRRRGGLPAGQRARRRSRGGRG